MHKLILATSAALFVSTGIAQVSPGPHASTYNGFSRGWSTTAQVGFTISGLDLPNDAFQSGDTAAFLVVINGTQVHHSFGTTTLPLVLGTAISVNVGDIVRVVGNWSPVGPGNFTAHNSYTSGGGTTSVTIAGVAHTVYRAGQQWDVGDPAFGGTGFDGLTGSMGRVFIYDTTLSNYALNENYGEGCYSEFRSFYEAMGSGQHDLANSAMTMLNTGAAYTMIGGIAPPWQSTLGATALVLGDDSDVTMTLTSGSIIVPGEPPAMSLTVCSNGFISTGMSNGTAYSPSAGAMLNHTDTGFYCWHDFTPSYAGSGQVMWEETAAYVYVTWDDVWSFGNAAGPGDTFQFQFEKATGHVHILWGTINNLGNNHVIGFSPAGPNLNPGSTDISVELPQTFSTFPQDVAALALDASARPVIGTSLTLDTSNIPAGSPIVGTLLSLTEFNPGVDLTSIGMAGCFQYCGSDAVILFVAPGATTSAPFNVPNNAGLAGVMIKCQSAALHAAANLLGAISSNGVRLTIDLN